MTLVYRSDHQDFSIGSLVSSTLLRAYYYYYYWRTSTIEKDVPTFLGKDDNVVKSRKAAQYYFSLMIFYGHQVR